MVRVEKQVSSCLPCPQPCYSPGFVSHYSFVANLQKTAVGLPERQLVLIIKLSIVSNDNIMLLLQNNLLLILSKDINNVHVNLVRP